MTKFKTQFDPKYKPNKGSKNNQESQTQPDMTLSVRAIMKNHTRGMGFGVSVKDGIYSDSDIPVFYDLTDMVEHKEHLEEQAAILKKEIAEERKKAKQRDEAEKERLRREKELNDSPLSEKAKKSLKEPPTKSDE